MVEFITDLFNLIFQLLKDMEKPLFEYKESQKKGRKEVSLNLCCVC